jgi:hypothetical protein
MMLAYLKELEVCHKRILAARMVDLRSGASHPRNLSRDVLAERWRTG